MAHHYERSYTASSWLCGKVTQSAVITSVVHLSPDLCSVSINSVSLSHQALSA